jgi:hypothetical protein
MLVTLKVLVPDELDEEQRQALAKYAKSTDGVDVRAKLLRDATSA